MGKTVDVRIGARVPRRGNAFSRAMAALILRLLRWQIRGELPDRPKFVFVAGPHTSNMDGIVGLTALAAMGLSASTMIKDSAFRGPLGPLLRWLGAIPVDRRSPKGVVEQSVDAFARNSQLVLLIAPEGTRHGAREFKRGYHHIARGAGVPVLAATIHYRRRVVEIGPLIEPSADCEADTAKIVAFWSERGWPGHPERLSRPMCEALGRPWTPPTRD